MAEGIDRGFFDDGPRMARLDAVRIIRLRESSDVRRVIEVLAGVTEPDLAEVEARVQAGRKGGPP